MTLTTEKLDEIERLAELATPGPWYYAGCNTVHDADHDEVAHPCDMTHDCATARFIAALDPATVRELVRAARERDHQAARIAEREKPCVWTPEGEDSSSWNTGCGSSFWFDDGHEGVNFCPFCGHPAVFDHEGDSA